MDGKEAVLNCVNNNYGVCSWHTVLLARSAEIMGLIAWIYSASRPSQRPEFLHAKLAKKTDISWSKGVSQA